MSRTKTANLPELHLEILKAVWTEWSYSRHDTAVDGGLTRDEIFGRLEGKIQTQARGPKSVGKHLIEKPDTLKKHLKELCDTPPNQLISKPVSNRGGLPFVYMINDVTTVTWPSTAYMLLHVWDTKSVTDQVLIEAMIDEIDFSIGHTRATTTEEITRVIRGQIDWSKAHGYLESVEHHPSVLHPSPRENRLQYEYQLLKFIAAGVHYKNQALFDPRDSGTST